VSVELVHLDGDAFVLSDAGWRGVLELALACGWHPGEVLAGLTPPFRVKAVHCARLGEIIDAAMDEASLGPAETGWRADETLRSLFAARSAPHWRRFAKFCRGGEVMVRVTSKG
jgi:hypothetical protein